VLDGGPENRHDSGDLGLLPKEWVRTGEYKAALNVTTLTSNQKHNVDYALALQECSKHQSRHVLVLEDDIVSAEGLLRSIDELMPVADSMYYKLYWPDMYDGWTVKSALLWVAFVLCFCGILAAVFRLPPCSLSELRCRNLRWFHVAFVTMLVWPLLAGKQGTVDRVRYLVWPTQPAGQAFLQAALYPQRVADALTSFMQENPRLLNTDLLASQWAETNGLTPTVIRPSFFQHVGIRTSLADKLKILNTAGNKEDYASWFKEDSLFVEDREETNCRSHQLVPLRTPNATTA
jgi:hypothetical protein